VISLADQKNVYVPIEIARFYVEAHGCLTDAFCTPYFKIRVLIKGRTFDRSKVTLEGNCRRFLVRLCHGKNLCQDVFTIKLYFIIFLLILIVTYEILFCLVVLKKNIILYLKFGDILLFLLI